MIAFSRIGATLVYERRDAPSGPGWLAFLLTAPAPSPPDQIPIDAAWSSAERIGYFVFLAEPPADPAVFAAALAEYRKDHPDRLPDLAHTSFAWIVRDAAAGAVTGDFALLLAPGDPRPVVARGVRFPFANYGLPFEAESEATALAGAGGIDGFRIAFPAGLPGLATAGEAAGLFLPLDGAGRYALAGQAMIADFSDDPLTGWDVSLRYAYADRDAPLGLRMQRYPLFRSRTGGGGEAARQYLFDGRWDPLDPLNRFHPDRTFLAFTGLAFEMTLTERGEVAEGTLRPAEAVLETDLRTSVGGSLALQPVPGSARLVFQPLPSPDGPRFYLVPEGDFELRAPAEDGPHKLLCGLAGSEFVAVTTASAALESGDRLTFAASRPAFAPVFPVIGSADLSTGPLLTGDFVTAWARPRRAPQGRSPGPVYFSQPREAGLFAPAGAEGVLTVFDAPAARFEDPASDPFFPLAPYAGVLPDGGGFPAGDLRRYEEQILVPVRRAAIAAAPAAASRPRSAAAARTTTTPQGFLARVNDLSWESVLLARASDEDAADLELVQLPGRLRQALQSSQLFLVATRAEPLGDFRNRVRIAGWPFTIDVAANEGAAREFRNVLVFKFGAGSVRERARDPGAWTDAAGFNDDPLSVSAWLQRYIDEAEQQAEKSERLRDFLHLVENPAWNGVLALRVDVGLEEFPRDLKGLLAGIVPEEFFGHHLGIEVNFVEESAGAGLAVPRSSLFGLIAYQDRGFANRQSALRALAEPRTIQFLHPTVALPEPGGGRYDFRVLSLQVVFANSDIADFKSLVSLTADTWFGAPAVVQTGTPLSSIAQFAVELSGAYENHEGHRTYTFNTLPDASYKFTLGSAALHYVDVVKAQFSTTDVRDRPQGGQRIASLFTFWGFLNFRKVEGFDAFSFGDLAGGTTTRQGLFFSNVNVEMSFDFDPVAGRASDRAFRFDVAKAALDRAQSDVRPNSLLANFPLGVAGLLEGGPGRTPEDMEFLEVRAPAFAAAPLEERWFGLVFDLNLGSLGALAANAGFKASLLAAWSPDPEALKAAVLIKLPLVGGGKKTLSLQNVLRLGIGGLEFLTDEVVAGQLAYILRLRGIALSFLGVKLPPGSETSALLFGDPAAPAAGGNLGWYAAFIKDEKRPALPTG